MNITSILVAFVVAVALWFGGDHFGHTRGINEQKVADQERFDKVNTDLADQKAKASKLLAQKNTEAIALMSERDKFKTDLEKEREKNRVATDALRDRYADIGLRFNAGESAGCRGGSGVAQSAAPDPSSLAGAPVIQLPDSIAGNLRRLVYDADRLADDYRKCYAYAQQVK